MRAKSFVLVLLAVLASAGQAFAGGRVALAIGVSNYQDHEMHLSSPVKDARAIGEALTRFGFDVTLVQDPTSDSMREALDAFLLKAKGADMAVVYFSGHGLQVNGEAYLIPADDGFDRPDGLRRDHLAVASIVEKLEGAGAAFKFVIVDACRSNPYLNRGRAMLEANLGRAEQHRVAQNAMVAFASAPGQNSQDWASSLGLSLYTAALVDVLRQSDHIDVRDVVLKTRILVEAKVRQAGAEPQMPWEEASLMRPITFDVSAPGRMQPFAPGLAIVAPSLNGKPTDGDATITRIAPRPVQPVASTGAGGGPATTPQPRPTPYAALAVPGKP